MRIHDNKATEGNEEEEEEEDKKRSLENELMRHTLLAIA